MMVAGLGLISGGLGLLLSQVWMSRDPSRRLDVAAPLATVAAVGPASTTVLTAALTNPTVAACVAPVGDDKLGVVVGGDLALDSTLEVGAIGGVVHGVVRATDGAVAVVVLDQSIPQPNDTPTEPQVLSVCGSDAEDPRAVAGTEIDAMIDKATARIGWCGLSAQGDSDVIATVDTDSPAASAGIVAGDRVRALDTEPVTSAAQLLDRLRLSQPGDTVSITLLRDGALLDVVMTLG
jgi:membrane-associated protease RseP (regulator of RpoE activity)